MSAISWDLAGEHFYEAGVDHGVFYKEAGGEFISGVPWNGLVDVSPNIEGMDISNLYSGGIKRGLASTGEEYGGKISAYTYPDEVDECIGGSEVVPGLHVYQQERALFGFSYRTLIGNEIYGTEYGYKIHLIYNAQITDVSFNESTLGDSADAEKFDFTFVTIPLDHSVVTPYSEIILDTSQMDSEVVELIETILYGSDDADPRMPTLEELRQVYYLWKYSDITEDWEGYPYETLYPSSALYPYPL